MTIATHGARPRTLTEVRRETQRAEFRMDVSFLVREQGIQKTSPTKFAYSRYLEALRAFSRREPPRRATRRSLVKTLTTQEASGGNAKLTSQGHTEKPLPGLRHNRSIGASEVPTARLQLRLI